MKLICKMLGGSHSYGLQTPSSDMDYRGVFVNTEVATLVGLSKHEHQQNQGNGNDEVYTEFRNALSLLRNGNTQVIEMLFNDMWIDLGDEWRLVRKYREKLVDSEKLFSCLRGYMQGELRLANGERTGKLGGKRKEAIDKYGFSPKNFVQLFRLGWAGSVYFWNGYFPVNIAAENPAMAASLMDIKCHPERYTKEQLNEMAVLMEKDLVKIYENRRHTTKFDESLAHDLCLRVYGPLIQKAYEARVDN